jgi:hypothetical protein
MQTKSVVMEIDEESGAKEIWLSGGEVKKSVSMSNDGSELLDSLGADVVLHFDQSNKLVSIELIGL